MTEDLIYCNDNIPKYFDNNMIIEKLKLIIDLVVMSYLKIIITIKHDIKICLFIIFNCFVVVCYFG